MGRCLAKTQLRIASFEGAKGGQSSPQRLLQGTIGIGVGVAIANGIAAVRLPIATAIPIPTPSGLTAGSWFDSEEVELPHRDCRSCESARSPLSNGPVLIKYCGCRKRCEIAGFRAGVPSNG